MPAINPRLVDDYTLTPAPPVTLMMPIESQESKNKRTIAAYLGEITTDEECPNMKLVVYDEDWAGGLHPTVNT